MKYWNEQMECMSVEERRELQSERLVKLVERVYNNVAPYRKKMDAIGLKPEDIRSIDDLGKLPFTLKQDLRDNYPYGLFAVPMTEIVRIHASSGTTGKQTVVGYTKNDLDMWTECMARSLTAAGATAESIVHVAYGYGLFTGGLGAHYGAEALGASVIPVSSGNTARQITILQDFRPDILMCTPSYAMYLAEELRAAGKTPGDIYLKAGVFGAEPWSEQMRRDIERGLGIKALNIYGLSEIMGPAVSCECMEQSGMHVQEDNFLIEILNPETGEPVPDGEQGEVVITTLTKEGLPLIRYRTRDLSSVVRERCACGRTTARMQRITGRTDDMLIIRGVNVFPSQIESVLLEMNAATPNYMIIVDRKDNHDTMEVQVEMNDSLFSDQVKDLESIENSIKARLNSVLGISVKLKLVEPKTLPRSEGKAKRVIDKRKI
jgi:phenylacetate-CoA ligase